MRDFYQPLEFIEKECPEITDMDVRIKYLNGTTTALETQKDRLRATKAHESINTEARLQRLVEQNSALLAEIAYYRDFYDFANRYRHVTTKKFRELQVNHELDQIAYLYNKDAYVYDKEAVLSDEEASLYSEKASLYSEKASLYSEKASLCNEKSYLDRFIYDFEKQIEGVEERQKKAEDRWLGHWGNKLFYGFGKRNMQVISRSHD